MFIAHSVRYYQNIFIINRHRRIGTYRVLIPFNKETTSSESKSKTDYTDLERHL